MGFLIAVFLLWGCKPEPPPPPLDEHACEDASARYGARVCVHEIPDIETWNAVTVDADPVDQIRSTKHLIPASDDAPLPPLFLDSNTIQLHYDLMSRAFPDQFPGLRFEEYVAMVLDPEDRVFYGGDVNEYLDPSGGTYFGFTVWDDPADESKTIRYEDVLAVWNAMQARFGPIPLFFVPNSGNQREAIETWESEFPIRGTDDAIVYEPYTVAVGYGNVRLMDIAELAQATEDGTFGFQDLLVLDEAPFDVERVTAGFVTGTRQGALSHLNVRAAARGTPNCYIADPHRVLAAWNDQLVRFECGAANWRIEATTEAEAGAWWDAIRPEPLEVDVPDTTTAEVVGLLDLPTATADERAAAFRAYGAKGTNLATLYQRIPAEIQLDGFVIPFAYYDAFVRESTWLGPVVGPTRMPVSFSRTLRRWHADSRFRTDGAVRGEHLERLRDAMEAAPVDPAVVAALEDRIVEVWGDDTTMVRFRSSSNAEDALGFSGAGLYDSTSACVADGRDGDTLGPSRCDPEQPEERPVDRALKKVWASLWNLRAWEEREWYGIDHDRVVMGVLVDTRAANEQANIVAFTGNPTADDDRYLVDAQIGEYDVVAAEAGVSPEQTLLELDASGEVVGIVRVSQSSEADLVLDDARLEELGEALWDIEQVFPIDDIAPEGRAILLDTEWKVWEDGRLVIKQVRPFLR